MYLGSQREVKLITTCSHLVHASCHSKNMSEVEDYFLCNFCKTASNLLVSNSSNETDLKK